MSCTVLLCIVIIVLLEPVDVTILCLTQSTIAEFECAVRNTSGIPSIGWEVQFRDRNIQSVEGPRYMTNNSTAGSTTVAVLTITDVSVNDNGTQYRCVINNNMYTNFAILTVPGKIIIMCNIFQTVGKYIYKCDVMMQISHTSAGVHHIFIIEPCSGLAKAILSYWRNQINYIVLVNGMHNVL